jgi:hypothetical protein
VGGVNEQDSLDPLDPLDERIVQSRAALTEMMIAIERYDKALARLLRRIKPEQRAVIREGVDELHNIAVLLCRISVRQQISLLPALEFTGPDNLRAVLIDRKAAIGATFDRMTEEDEEITRQRLRDIMDGKA